jgi:tetratricopeptide (TPR) repeat protein
MSMNPRGASRAAVPIVTLALAGLLGAGAATAGPVQAGVASAPAPAAVQIAQAVEAYLQMVAAMRDAALDPVRTQILIQHQIKESYEKAGKPLEAVAEFRRLLETTKQRDARIGLRFAIIDVYNANGKNEEALAELRALFAENLARLPEK